MRARGGGGGRRGGGRGLQTQKSIKCLKGGTKRLVGFFPFFLVKIGKNWYLVKNKCEFLRIALQDPAFLYLDLYREALGLRLHRLNT